MTSKPTDEASVNEQVRLEPSDCSNMQEFPGFGEMPRRSLGGSDPRNFGAVAFLLEHDSPVTDLDGRKLGHELSADDDLPEMDIVTKNLWDD